MTIYEVQYLENKTWKKVFDFRRSGFSDWAATCEAEDLIEDFKDNYIEEDEDPRIKNILDSFKLRLIKYHEDGYSVIESWD